VIDICLCAGGDLFVIDIQETEIPVSKSKWFKMQRKVIFSPYQESRSLFYLENQNYVILHYPIENDNCIDSLDMFFLEEIKNNKLYSVYKRQWQTAKKRIEAIYGKHGEKSQPRLH
jgi:hypothetical protein